MGHYAKVEDGVVTQIIVADQSFIDQWHSEETWIKTSYNTRGGIHYKPTQHDNDERIPSDDQSKALRKNFAGIGYIYDSVKDAFYPPKPFSSWTLNNTTCLWEPPLSKPTDGQGYTWDENAYQADNTQGWKLVDY